MIDFTMPGHPAPVLWTWKQGLVQSSPLNRSRADCDENELHLVRGPGECPLSFPPNIRRPAASLQRRLSGGETDPECFIRPSYDAAGGASEAKRRGNFTSGTQTGHSRRGLILQCIEISNNIYATTSRHGPMKGGKHEKADFG